MQKYLLVFQTDFTLKEGAVASMYGVVKSVDRDLEIITATHEIPQYDTWSASLRLWQYSGFWPKGTVFVSVVDPGVGTHRKASAAKTKDGNYVVTPDNGTLTHLKHYTGIEEIREIDESVNRLLGKGTEKTSIFHGRDLFSYCAARLASGIIDFNGVGKPYSTEEIVTHKITEPELKNNAIYGIIEISDPNFGNAWTNIPLEMMSKLKIEYGDSPLVKIKYKEKIIISQRIPFQKSFGFVDEGQLVVYNNELSRIGIAVSKGSFSKIYNTGFGPEWQVEIKL